MDDDSGPFGEDFLAQLYGPSRRTENGIVPRKTRHASSHVDFRSDANVEKIPEDENSRKKERTKPWHCSSFHCQAVHDGPLDTTCYNENIRRKNSEKPEAALSQHLDHATSKIGKFLMKNRRVSSSSQQRNQNYRPGTSTTHSKNRNNPPNSGVHRHSRKCEKPTRHECTRFDSTFSEIVNSVAPTVETDHRIPYDLMHSRNACKDSDLSWHSPPGEPHSEPETDCPVKNLGENGFDGKKRHSGQGESIDENLRYERDQRELKDLDENLREFVRCKMSSGRVVQEEKESDDDNDDDDDDDDEMLKKINFMVSKLPVPRKRNAPTRKASKSQDKCSSSPNERTRTRTSKIEARKTYHSSGIDGRPAEPSKDQDSRRKSENSKLDIELKNSKLLRVEAEQDGDEMEEEEEEVEDELDMDQDVEEEEEKNSRKEEDAGSETEEEARQLVKDEKEMERFARKLTKSWSKWKRDKNQNSRIVEEFNVNDRNCQRSNFHKTAKISREARNDGRERTKISHDRSKILSNVARANCCEGRDEVLDDELVTRGSKSDFPKNRTRERDLQSEERTRGRMYERANSVLDFSRKKCIGASSLCCDDDDEDRALVASETRTLIDEMIDDGLNRETTREKTGTLLDTRKDLPAERTERVFSSKRGSNVDESRKIISPECTCETRTRRRELSPIGDRKILANGRTRPENCLYDEFAKIFTDDTSLRRDYVRKLKNRRWAYLDNMQNSLEKLCGLERFLDTWLPERNPISTVSNVARENFVPATRQNEAKKSEKKSRDRLVTES